MKLKAKMRMPNKKSRLLGAIASALVGCALVTAAPNTVAHANTVANQEVRNSESVKQWIGSGTVYDDQRNEISTFDVKVLVSRDSSGENQRQDILITHADGSTKSSVCTRTGTGNDWHSACDDGFEGGGYMFGDGIGLDYKRNGDLESVTQVVVDNPLSMRILTTILRQGEVLNYISQRLVLAPSSGNL